MSRTAQVRAEERRRAKETRMRAIAFGGIAVGVLAIGALLAFGGFLARPSASAGVIDVQSSMAGSARSEIRVTAGETATLNWWTEDAAVHLQRGVHTLVSLALDLYEELAASSTGSAAVEAAVTTPGTTRVA